MATISVIMPTYNNEREIGLSIRSVLAQDVEGLELIVVNDASTDATGSVCERFQANDPRVVVLHHTHNQGRARARNLAIEHAHSDLIAVLDADDLAMPGRFARQIGFLCSHPEIGMLGSWAIRIDQHNHPVGLLTGPTQDAGIRRRLRQLRMPFLHSTTVFRRAVLYRAGLYDPDFVRSQDAHLFRRVIRFTQAACLPEFLVLYRLEANPSPQSARSRYQWSARAGWESLKREPDLFGTLNLARLVLLSRLPLPLVKVFSGLYRINQPPAREQLLATQEWIERLAA